MINIDIHDLYVDRISNVNLLSDLLVYYKFIFIKNNRNFKF